MGKALTGLIVVIIIAAVVGGAAGYYYFYYLDKDDEGGNTKTDTLNKLPIAVFEFENGSSGRVGELLWFNANGSSDPDGKIVRYEWDFDDGGYTISNVTRVNHTYLMPSEYDVNLTVTDDNGGKDTIIKTLTIRPADYTDSAVAVLLSREPLGYPSELNRTIPVEEFAVSMTINISFIGASWGQNTVDETVLEVVVMNPLGEEIGNVNESTRIQQAYVPFIFSPTELKQTGDYELIATCTQGSLQLSYEIEVLY